MTGTNEVNFREIIDNDEWAKKHTGSPLALKMTLGLGFVKLKETTNNNTKANKIAQQQSTQKNPT